MIDDWLELLFGILQWILCFKDTDWIRVCWWFWEQQQQQQQSLIPLFWEEVIKIFSWPSQVRATIKTERAFKEILPEGYSCFIGHACLNSVWYTKSWWISQAYKRVLDKPVTELREAGICMRENPFYVDTVRRWVKIIED